MELLEVNHLCKTYGSGETAVHALKDVSFSVPKGEYAAVVGESGSGITFSSSAIPARVAFTRILLSLTTSANFSLLSRSSINTVPMITIF